MLNFRIINLYIDLSAVQSQKTLPQEPDTIRRSGARVRSKV
jgi:hypothetical protein